MSKLKLLTTEQNDYDRIINAILLLPPSLNNSGNPYKIRDLYEIVLGTGCCPRVARRFREDAFDGTIKNIQPAGTKSDEGYFIIPAAPSVTATTGGAAANTD